MRIAFKSKRSIFKTWLFSYIFMMLIPIILSIFLSTISKKVIFSPLKYNRELVIVLKEPTLEKPMK